MIADHPYGADDNGVTPPRPPYTDAQYVAIGANVCPFCGSGNIRGDELEVDGTKAFQACWCNDCGKNWADLYKLVGYEETD